MRPKREWSGFCIRQSSGSMPARTKWRSRRLQKISPSRQILFRIGMVRVGRSITTQKDRNLEAAARNGGTEVVFDKGRPANLA